MLSLFNHCLFFGFYNPGSVGFRCWNSKAESVLVIQDFGIQLRLKYISGVEETKVWNIKQIILIKKIYTTELQWVQLLTWSCIQFIDRDKVDGIFMHECIRGCKIHYHLAFLLHCNKRLALSFKHVYPGFSELQRVYTACKKLWIRLTEIDGDVVLSRSFVIAVSFVQ